ncbi:HAMP domain-containing sensor histidine kinase [Sphingomonas alpina]|uniref:HAMP domain-containing sensor histidine kinase n=1 Tax=Sphingomonas alpina TaxID=653931 RepID=UPI001E29FE08|nr:HAMP domain-containing sensor histidine kinase [Sphingomonas alpina]
MRLIRPIKELAKRHWPALPLRTILFGTLLFVAALPGFGAVFLRVYENTIVQQTEAELIAQGAVLAAAYKSAWNDGKQEPQAQPLAPEPPQIDLRTMTVLPPGTTNPADHPADPHAIAVARQMQSIADDSAAVTLAAVRLLDRDGIVVLGRRDLGQSYAGAPEVGRALTGRSGTVLRQRQEFRDGIFWETISRAATIRVHHARPVIAQGQIVGVVMLSRSPRGLLLGIYQDRGKIALGVALIFGTLLVLVALLSRGIARPIATLTRATQAVAQGSSEIPETPPTAAIEIRELFDNFRIMADRIALRSRYLRDFATAVSHEFKTPIAGIRGALELLDDHWATMDAEDRRRFIANASADAERLQRLTDRLLDLARADMAKGDSAAIADITPIARRVAARFGTMQVSVTTDLTSALARIAPEVLETVLDTLVTNSAQAGARTVSIAIDLAGDAIVIVVHDDGPGIPPADAERVFEPFFTGRRESGGTGLGLSIARSLLAATGGTIAILPARKGAVVEIRLMTGG